jgi:hypothetical protein
MVEFLDVEMVNAAVEDVDVVVEKRKEKRKNGFLLLSLVV